MSQVLIRIADFGLHCTTNFHNFIVDKLVFQNSDIKSILKINNTKSIFTEDNN